VTTPDLLVRWFPPAWVQIVASGSVLYIDPAFLVSYFADYPPHVVFTRWPDEIDGLPEPDLPPADVILITHGHKDHFKPVTIERLRRPATQLVAPRAVTRRFDGPAHTVEAGDELELHGFQVRAVPAHNTHEGRPTRKQHRPGTGVGFLAEAAGRTVYHAGDTDLLAEMSNLGDVDLALLPIGGTFTLDVDEAIEAALRIKPRLVHPIHNLRRVDPADFTTALRRRSRLIEPVPPVTGAPIPC
jgi:L-ascorbate metabolism protein UlaG (beta-lactamase superfamily)